MGIHDRIREAREQAGVSQTELARLLGVTRSACSQWESATGTAPRRERLEQLAQLLGVSFEWLATGRGGSGPSAIEVHSGAGGELKPNSYAASAAMTITIMPM